MYTILKYITNGRGVGAIIILLIATIFSVIVALSIRSVANMSVPYIQMAADDVLPLKLENGKITEPVNFKKVFPLYLDSDENQFSFVLDTTVDTLDTTDLDSGIYVTRSQVYAVNNAKGKIESRKLEGSIYLEKKDYTQELNTIVKWIVIFVTLVLIVPFFIMYFIANLFYAFCAAIAEKVSGTKLNFDAKMRLSAICFSIMILVSYILSFLGVNIPLLIFVALVIALQILFAKQIAV